MLRFHKFAFLACVLLGSIAGAIGRDEPTGYEELEPTLRSAPIPVELTEADLQAMSLEDPRLRIAYASLINQAGAPWKVDNRRPYMVAALHDLKRRGDAATPLLLDIMDKNHNTDLEDLIPFFVMAVGSFKMEPYIDYIRHLVQTRPMEINGSACQVFAMLFIGYGTEDDIKRLQALAVRRPYLASFLERELETQKWKPSAKSPPEEVNHTQGSPAK